MDTMAGNESLVFFKALADASRLKIVGLLAQEPLTVEQLAAMLDLSPSTVSHHLARLAKVGLVSARAEGYYSVYRLEAKALEEMSRRVLSGASLPAAAADVDLDAYDRKIINDFSLPDGRLKTIPAQYKKFVAILRHVVRAFAVGVRYTEKDVNDILSRFHEDTASLRRGLVEEGLLARQGSGSEYWRVES